MTSKSDNKPSTKYINRLIAYFLLFFSTEISLEKHDQGNGLYKDFDLRDLHYKSNLFQLYRLEIFRLIYYKRKINNCKKNLQISRNTDLIHLLVLQLLKVIWILFELEILQNFFTSTTLLKLTIHHLHYLHLLHLKNKVEI